MTPSGRRRIHAADRHRVGVVGLAASAMTVAGLVAISTPGSVGAQAPAGPTLSVDVSAGQHPISPLIYGMNDYQADAGLEAQLKTPVVRLGGDATTRYDWEADSSNAGGDWYFMSGSGEADPTPSGGPDALVRQDQSWGGRTILTVPIIGWINNSAATNCSFPTSVYGAQQSVNPYVTLPGGAQCGDGLTPAGQPIADTDITANNMVNSPGFEAQWVQHLVSTFGSAATAGIIYEMDNEPSGWNNTHRDVHPASTGWDELVGDTEAYGAAVKAADPTATVDGPGDFGWAAYVDAGPPGDNRASHGGSIWEAQYYLQQLALYQAQHGVRLLDDFDEHYYPTTQSDDTDGCIALCEAGGPLTQAARLESTRSLWDPTYVEDDWIGQWYGAIDLIPRMKSWTSQYYPGTKTAISEYNFGALDSLNGALTEADALGIFGYQGLDMATLWGPPTATQPGAFAFKMYQDYDGAGSTFGNTSVQSISADQSQLSVYGAERDADGALTVMVVNKTVGPLTSRLNLKGFTPGATAGVYTYDGADLNAIVPGPGVPVTAKGATVTFPADSITLLVIPPGSGPASGQGYWEAAADGGVFAFGDAPYYGSMAGRPLRARIVTLTATPDAKGYWEVGADGGVFAFGDAQVYGSMGGQTLTRPVVAMTATPDAKGYWEVAADGGVFAFGDARFYGSMGGQTLTKPIVAVAATPDGAGYWEVAADGGVFAFGDARFYGSMGGQTLTKPIVAVAATPDGAGYWEVAADGGVFAFGDALFYGSTGGQRLTKPIVDVATTPDGAGYWEVAADGGVFAFGDARFYGSMGGQTLTKPIVALSR